MIPIRSLSPISETLPVTTTSSSENVTTLSPSQLTAAQHLIQQLSQQHLLSSTTFEQQQQAAAAAVASAVANAQKEQFIRSSLVNNQNGIAIGNQPQQQTGGPPGHNSSVSNSISQSIGTHSIGTSLTGTSLGNASSNFVNGTSPLGGGVTNSIPILKPSFGKLISPAQLIQQQQHLAAAQRIVPHGHVLSSSPGTTQLISTSAPIDGGGLTAAQQLILRARVFFIFR